MELLVLQSRPLVFLVLRLFSVPLAIAVMENVYAPVDMWMIMEEQLKETVYQREALEVPVQTIFSALLWIQHVLMACVLASLDL
ncbi:hypothetical protein DPMN_013088 [Dreissena polymorpha]|uniref:Uncharacterized protein n=1 Tax=Dreissena polymorpha TaxID=45954 RepID=A0A9D4N4Q3_DREPO|nr:hypothetical protein DPMN_013088 [Dreissena polymorpha]